MIMSIDNRQYSNQKIHKVEKKYLLLPYIKLHRHLKQDSYQRLDI